MILFFLCFHISHSIPIFGGHFVFFPLNLSLFWLQIFISRLKCGNTFYSRFALLQLFSSSQSLPLTAR
jgi:hypothetical protein